MCRPNITAREQAIILKEQIIKRKMITSKCHSCEGIGCKECKGTGRIWTYLYI